ncbi:peptidase inhibitor family I36 protein [Nonomuraea purpurea]|uniref:Peptidase inhibitor family I36 protein n=1 Tax=Nonomuraea purpurea TaxID=1849276 RepID=A0ABV8GVB5_9ACTN
MNSFSRWAMLVTATATMSTGLVLPASAATSQPQIDFVCPLVVSVCGFTQPNGSGQRKLLFDQQARINPALRSAANNTGNTWCFYSQDSFRGQSREVSAGDVVNDFGFGVRSARPSSCNA